MFSSIPSPFRWSSRANSTGANLMSLDQVPAHDVETSTDRRARTLKHLLKANHTNHSIIYNHLRFHNHAPHILGSAHILGANAEQMQKIYDVEDRELDPWADSPSEISRDDWREYLSKRNFARAYVDFFEDELVRFGYDWKRLLEHYLYEGKEPLINSVIVSGLGHPVIHLGYAYELASQTVATETLGLTACFYTDNAKYLNDPSYTRPSSFKSKSMMEILTKVAGDQRLDDHSSMRGETSVESVMDKKEDIVLDYWNAWDLDSDPREQFAESQRAATAITVATREKSGRYDFFLLHVLTTSHAVRILLPEVPKQHQLPLVRQWWLFTLMSYIGQLRPAINLKEIEDVDVKGKDWPYVNDLAINSRHATDAHYVKGLRAMMNAAETWGDASQFYLKAAVKFAEDFSGWRYM
ncbi:MAG: hypothetical protein Q9162_004460 [Coniocarpon cinnabarinum]